MHIRRTLAAAAAALTLSPAVLAEEHPLIGTWSGTWPNDLYVELTITHVADTRRDTRLRGPDPQP